MKKLPIPFIPHDYQEPINEELATHDHYGVLAFPGSGKTAMALLDIYNWKEPSLVVVPLEIMVTTWTTEHAKWEFSQNLKLNILHGPDKDKNFHRRAGVTLINPEGLVWLLKTIKRTKRFPWKNLYVDESVKFKNHKSVRFKSLCKLLKTFKKRRILCANPMPNSYLDLWAQLFILDLGERLGTSWYQFRSKYFYPTDFKRFNWELKPGAKEEIVAAISDIVYFLDVTGDLPERIERDIIVQLPDKARKQYKEMEDKLFTSLFDAQADFDDDEEIRVLAKSKSSAHIKCWQIAQGFIYEQVDTGVRRNDEIVYERRTHHIHDALIAATDIHVEALQGSPIIIAYYFGGDLAKLRKRYPDARYANSSTSKVELKKIEEDWNEGNIPILISYVGKLSHGLNLQYGPGHHILFYCLTYNFDTYDQLVRRLERQGADFAAVIVHRLVVPDTIHEAILLKLAHKKDESFSFLDALKEYRNNLTD